jgi:hypothetical protein
MHTPNNKGRGEIMRALFLNIHSIMLRGAVGFVALLSITTVHAQVLRVTAANGSNSAVYDLTFSASGSLTGALTPVNTDASKFVGIRSLAYVRNLSPPGTIDLLVTDAQRGVVARYANITPYAGANPPPPEAATIVWSTACGPGPAAPDGISVDGSGNVFVVSSAPGGSSVAGLWVFPNAASQPAGTPPCSVTPRLVDSGFNGTLEQLLEETLFAFAITNPNQNGNTPTSTGDLLVLASSPTPAVFAYNGQDIQAFLSCTGAYPACSVTPHILIGQVQVPAAAACISGLSNLPAGLTPGGMDFWLPDNSLLISTAGGSILRYSFPGGVPCRLNDFADGLGNGKFKVKTGWQNHQASAFVANNNGGDILQFGEPLSPTGPGTLKATVTTGVQRPQGLVVSNLNVAPASACQVAGGCDLLGGVLKHTITGAGDLSNKFLIETPCIVQVDPRIAQYGTCTGHSLPVSQVCAGYGTTVIPESLCGGSGSPSTQDNQPHGFALIKTDNTVDSSLNGALVANDSTPDLVLAGTANPLCPKSILAWAPLESEGSVVEDVAGVRPMLEMTNFCDAGSTTKGNSIFAIGLVLNDDPHAMLAPNLPFTYVNFVNQKYTNLIAAVNAANVNKSVQQSLVKCIQSSQKDFNALPPSFAAALTELLSCDGQVVKSKTKFDPIPGIDPNPYGEIRGRIGNVYLWISYQFAGRGAPTQWPLP